MRRLAMVILITAFAVPTNGVAQSQTGKDTVYDQLNLFDDAFERIRRDSVDPVPDSKLIGAAITGMLSGLDPNAAYLDPGALKSLQNPATDGQPGIGLAVTLDNGDLKVISPRDGSPAAQAGIKPGDLIFAIDKEPIYELTLPQIEQKLRGPAGSTVALILRRGTGSPIRLSVKRAVSEQPTVTARIADGNIGYLRIAGFDGGTHAALAGAVQDLRQRTGGKLAGLILDLRNNPGGGFDAAVAVADAFIDHGDIVVIKGRKPDSVKRIAATPGDSAKGLPIVVIVNGGTAREAELVAGALQDAHRAVLLGTRTFGESNIETLIPLGSGGAIRLTTSRFTTPSGREIEGKGLVPDLTVEPLKLEKFGEDGIRHEADLPGALKNPDPATPTAPVTGAPPTSALPPAGTSPASSAPPAGANPTAAAKSTSSVATGDIGSAGDEQLTQALDVLRGLAVFNHRIAG